MQNSVALFEANTSNSCPSPISNNYFTRNRPSGSSTEKKAADSLGGNISVTVQTSAGTWMVIFYLLKRPCVGGQSTPALLLFSQLHWKYEKNVI